MEEGKKWPKTKMFDILQGLLYQHSFCLPMFLLGNVHKKADMRGGGGAEIESISSRSNIGNIKIREK